MRISKLFKAVRGGRAFISNPCASDAFNAAFLRGFDRVVPRVIVYGAAGIATGLSGPTALYDEGVQVGVLVAATADATLMALRTGNRVVQSAARTVADAALAEYRRRARAQLRQTLRLQRVTIR